MTTKEYEKLIKDILVNGILEYCEANVSVTDTNSHKSFIEEKVNEFIYRSVCHELGLFTACAGCSNRTNKNPCKAVNCNYRKP